MRSAALAVLLVCAACTGASEGAAGGGGSQGATGTTGTTGTAGHSPVLTWSGDQIAIDGVVSGPHLTGSPGAPGNQTVTGGSRLVALVPTWTGADGSRYSPPGYSFHDKPAEEVLRGFFFEQ